jgi:hypothetical protein
MLSFASSVVAIVTSPSLSKNDADDVSGSVPMEDEVEGRGAYEGMGGTAKCAGAVEGWRMGARRGIPLRQVVEPV